MNRGMSAREKRQERVNRCLPSFSLFIINPSLHLYIGGDAVRLYWGGAECVCKVTTRANSWPLGCPRSQQTINPVNVNWDNQRKRLHLWFPACKHFNTLRCWSRRRQGPQPWPRCRLQDSLVFVTWTKQREELGNLFPSAFHRSSLPSVAGFVICIKGPSEDDDQVDIFDSWVKRGPAKPKKKNTFPSGFCHDGKNKREPGVWNDEHPNCNRIHYEPLIGNLICYSHVFQMYRRSNNDIMSLKKKKNFIPVSFSSCSKNQKQLKDLSKFQSNQSLSVQQSRKWWLLALVKTTAEEMLEVSARRPYQQGGTDSSMKTHRFYFWLMSDWIALRCVEKYKLQPNTRGKHFLIYFLFHVALLPPLSPTQTHHRIFRN